MHIIIYMYTIIYYKYYCYNATDLNSKYERNSAFNIIIKQFIYRTSADSQEENKFINTTALDFKITCYKTKLIFPSLNLQ